MNGVYLADPDPDYGEDDGDDEPVAEAVPQPTRRHTELYLPHGTLQQYQAPAPKYPPRPSQVTQGPQRRSTATGPMSGTAAAGPGVKPPDRYKQTIDQNTSRANQQQVAKGNDKLPRKHIRSTKTHLVDKSFLAQLELIHSSDLRVGTSLTSDPRQSRISVFDPTPITIPLSRIQQQQSDVIQKRSQSEMKEIYDQIRKSNVLQPIPDRRHAVVQGSIRSADLGYGGSMTSRSSMPKTSSDPSLMVMPNCEYEEWALRWCLDEVGKLPGQLRSPKGVCVLRNSGNVIVADTKNARLQVFSGSSGKLISVFGVESLDQRIANTFYDVSQRRMEPCGLCETTDGSLLVVTDLNRVLYVDAESKHGGLQGSLPLPGKTHLSGVAITQNNKLILSEVGSSKPSVGLYENNGTLITAFKGDFRSPSYIAWNEELEIAAVSDGEQQCVLLYNASGKLLNKLGHQVLPLSTSTYPPSGPTSSALVYPAGICWLDAYRLLVADRSEHRVVVIDLRNSCVEDILTDAVGGLKHPVAIATNRRNRIVLTEEFYDFGVNESRLKMYRLMTSSQF